MHWTDNKLKKGQRRSLGGGTSPVISSTGDTFSSTSNTGDSYGSPTLASAPLQGMSPHSQSQSIVRPEQHHPTVVAPAAPSAFAQSQSSPGKSPSKARSFFRSGHHHTSSSEGGAHINTAIPSPSLHMNTSTSTRTIAGAGGPAGAGAEQEDDAQLLHIRLKQEAQERALRTSPRSSSITNSPTSNKTRHASNLSSGTNAPHSYGYDGRDVYPSTSPTAGHGQDHARSTSQGGGAGNTSIAPSSTSPNSTVGGGTNAGWYMTTGVLPAVIQTPPPGQENLSRSGSLGQRSKLSRYGSLFDATGLDRSGGGGTGTHRRDLSSEESEHQQDYTQNVSGLRSDILDHTADATAANRSIPPHSIGYQSHSPIYDQRNTTSTQHHENRQAQAASAQQNVSAIPVSMALNKDTSSSGLGSGGNQQGIPDAVTNAAQTAQHRRNISRDGGMMGTSPTRVQHAQLPHSTQQGAGNVGNAHAHANNQGRFQEEMNMVGRQSEDTPRGSTIGMLPAALANTGPSRGDSLKNKNRGADAMPVGAQGGLSAYNRSDLPPPTSGNTHTQGSRVLPAEMGENLPASEIARQRELQNAYATQGAREEPRVAASAVGISDPPTSGVAFQGQSRGLPQQKQRKEVANTATQGPSYQTTRTSEPKVISQQTSSYLEHPVPNISFPAPTHPQINDLFGNIAQPIPHYMFVNYTASVCQECVQSEKKMYALTHGGEKWRYVYSDPKEEKEIASDDPNTRKTGREEFKDEVSLLSSTAAGTNSWNKDGKGPCQCEQCLKNREIVKYAAENGLIEKIFEGRRHPASELIETITTTTIIRAPIIRETITTIWCEEPNCMECAVKQKEYDEAQRMRLLELAMNGLVVHETSGSDHYEGYENWLNVNGARGAAASSTSATSTTASDMNGKSGIDRLLKIAGNPRQEHLRRMPGTTPEFEGEIIGYDNEEVVGKSIEDASPSHGNVLQFVKSGLEARL